MRSEEMALELASSWDDIEVNLRTLEKYKNSSDYFQDYLEIIRDGICFVILEDENKVMIGPSRFIGYKENSIEKYRDPKNSKCGGDTNKIICNFLKAQPIQSIELAAEYQKLCNSIGIDYKPTGRGGYPKRYWFKGKMKLSKHTSNLSIDSGSDIDDYRIQEPVTEKENVILSRVGQGLFRKKLIVYWGGCAVTSCKIINILKASHIKPWSLSNNQERLDLYNGLLLVPNLDAAFDSGLISFKDDGLIIISSNLNTKDMELLEINPRMKINLDQKHALYLNYHRENIFLG